MKTALALCLAGVVGSGVMARADIAATQYVGHGIVPVDASTIRMVSAKVDIVWGEPGTLSAVFVMNNESAESADVQLGFPVSLPTQFRHKDRLDFTMTFDGVPADRAAIQQAKPDEEESGSRGEALWFHCRHRFPSGMTTVKVATKLPAIAVSHFPYREDLRYCIQTGAGWKGNIGVEEVAIHFPGPILPGQIDTCEPATGVVEGDTVRWRFEDFEPANQDHDILLRFIQPDVLPLLTDLRRRSAEAPGNTRRELELIKHLLALTPARYTLPLPSSKMRWNEYVEALAMLRPGRDRARFQALFVLRADGYCYEKNSDWTQDADELTSMFSAVDYVYRAWQWPFFAEGLGMLTQLLRDYPHNADAWNMYIQQSVGEPEWGFYPYQWERIETARNNCPGDPAIRLWESLYLMQRRLRHDQSPGITPAVRRFFAKKEQLYRLLRRRGIVDRFEGFTVRYHSVSDKYF